ncbi:SUMF1/EgtB/PvdO family nonheme iron enzyme [Streptomyces sp. DSM 41527]|uniref:SUMF1/EgtB/PvdO family nonheme iron enzyme n=1 Tax=Streptomyces mooreae TaxID=3075523 RepID=A0ABU2TEK6_9ACTN|nr:SUMF1/EgtB/PvdO family nonheme iron enzyme [Streptomyces sp. DSM 41527]MDT0459373.1 SUMF1/EgtB/PvdO family nonheme iron enzyme [Streptomyces sp. DSM 41527]
MDRPGVARWTGREINALREAMRKTVRGFAAAIGVSDRMVSKWEKGGENITPRPGNQAALDTLLTRSGLEVQERFAQLMTAKAAAGGDERTEALLTPGAQRHRHPADGKLMIEVEEGLYLGGADNTPGWLPAYFIDIYPVTNADYFRFTSATGHPAPTHWGTDRRCPDSIFDHPVVWTTWRDANAYAAWAGKALPTSEQWEKAARGAKGSIYPWGAAATAAKCNVQETGIGNTTPVSRYHSGVSPFGVYDMCGNTWEWCATESKAGRRAFKGSAFTSPFALADPASFNDAYETMSDNDTGFRCVTTSLDLGLR